MQIVRRDGSDQEVDSGVDQRLVPVPDEVLGGILGKKPNSTDTANRAVYASITAAFSEVLRPFRSRSAVANA